jgi:GNAT superfamily N-acetyltransferase
VGVARYVRSNDDAEVAELAVTVIDDWQGRGLGRLLLTRLTDRARREGVRRFSAVVLGQNREALRLFKSFGDVRREYDAGMVELVIELPPKRGIGARLAPARCGRRRRELVYRAGSRRGRRQDWRGCCGEGRELRR